MVDGLEEFVQSEQPTREYRRKRVGDAVVELGRRKDVVITNRSDIDREDEADHPNTEREAQGREEREHEVEHDRT